MERVSNSITSRSLELVNPLYFRGILPSFKNSFVCASPIKLPRFESRALFVHSFSIDKLSVLERKSLTFVDYYITVIFQILLLFSLPYNIYLCVSIVLMTFFIKGYH